LGIARYYISVFGSGICVFIDPGMEENMEQERTDTRIFYRGEIYDIGELEITGSEQQGCRPVLIVSCDEFNEYSPEVVIVFITSQLEKRGKQYHINLPGVIGLEKKSMVLAEQIRTIDKRRILEKRGQLDLLTMNRVDRGLKIILDLRLSQKEKEAKEALKKEKMKVFEEWKRVERLKVAISRSVAAQCSA
jgi:mRNA interferase MazF